MNVISENSMDRLQEFFLDFSKTIDDETSLQNFLEAFNQWLKNNGYINPESNKNIEDVFIVKVYENIKANDMRIEILADTDVFQIGIKIPRVYTRPSLSYASIKDKKFSHNETSTLNDRLVGENMKNNIIPQAKLYAIED